MAACSGGQRQGTGRHGGDDLGGDGHQGWRGRLGWGHQSSHFVVALVETLMDEVVRGFGGLRGERLRRVGQRASGGCVGGHVGIQAWIVRSETRRGARGVRVGGCEAGRWIRSCQAGVQAGRRFQGGTNGQILFIRHNGESVPHQAVGHTPISIFSDATVEKQNKLNSYSFTMYKCSKILHHLAYA